MHATLILALALLSPSSDDDWNVDGDHGPTKSFEYEATEGTWISVDVSPDGEQLVFDLLGHLYLMPVAGGRARALTEGRSWNMLPRFSPDGGRIAFTSDRSGSNDLWVLELESGELENVSQMDLPVFQGTWSLDGRALYGTALSMKVRFPAYRFNFHGEKQELIPAGGRAPVSSLHEHPTEEAIYFVHNDAQLPGSGPRIKRFDRRTGEVEVYVERPGGAAAAVLSPDGRHMAYVHRDDKETVLVVHEFGSEEERVLLRGLDLGRLESTSFYGCYSNLSWHPGGQEVFLSFGGGIHAVDIATGTAREIPFEAQVARPMTETQRFQVEVPRETAHTRSHRWSQPAGDNGILFEALGDLWLDEGGRRTNLTESAAHETNPVYDPGTNRVFYAAWTDDELGSVWTLDLGDGARKQLTEVASQYGSIAVAPDGTEIAFLRGAADIRKGTRLERQTDFELVLLSLDGEEREVTDITWTGNRYAKRPPTIRFSPDAQELYFTEYVDDALTLKRIHRSGMEEQALITFPNATRAVISPDFQWIAFREYHRTFVTPYEFVGKPLTVSAADGKGFTQRVDVNHDGDFTEWSPAGNVLYWTRGTEHCAKTLGVILADGDKLSTTDLSFEYAIDRPNSTIALTNVDVLTMNAAKVVLEDVTVLIQRDTITAIGKDLVVPSDANVLDLSGRTIMPGMFDAHGHYGSPVSTLNVIEQRLYGLHANLAYGVTTMFDVYGTTQKDFWVSDMLQAGKIDGPRIYSVGDTVFVTKYRTKMHRPIHSLDDAHEIAAFNKDHGATALKDYSNHTRAARQQLAQACREMQLNLVTESFSNPQMNLTQIADGFTGIEHTLGLTPLYDDVLSFFAASEVGMTPTLIVVYNGPAGERYFHMRERLWEDEKLLNFFRRDELLRYRRPTHYFEDDFYHMTMAAELTKLYRRGVLLQMGAHGQMMGLGAHWEMEMFVHGGFTPYEAIEIATINGFKHHGLDHALGSLEPGKLADLVVLRENPLEDIRNSRSIEYVMKNGQLYDGNDAARVHPTTGAAKPMYFQRQ
jgi:imidazolonepropionase-like amidohydrolase